MYELEKHNEALAKFLGYTYIYNTLEDFSDCGGLETECKVYSKVPLNVEFGSITPNHWRDRYDDFFIIDIGGYPSGNKASELLYHRDWNCLMEVVKAIENLDDSEYFYQWEDVEGNTRSNFQRYSVDVEGNSCWICAELELDPPIIISARETDDKIKSVHEAVVEFVEWRMSRIQ